MKHRINQKGLGHHMLLLVVAVVAVVGAAGYFVWQRQEEDIDAKAAGLVSIAASSTTASRAIQMFACKNPSRLGAGNFVVSFGGRKKLSSTTGYRIKRGNWLWQRVNFGTRTYAYPTSALQAYKTDIITFEFLVQSGGLPGEPQTYRSMSAGNIPNC